MSQQHDLDQGSQLPEEIHRAVAPAHRLAHRHRHAMDLGGGNGNGYQRHHARPGLVRLPVAQLTHHTGQKRPATVNVDDAGQTNSDPLMPGKSSS